LWSSFEFFRNAEENKTCVSQSEFKSNQNYKVGVADPVFKGNTSASGCLEICKKDVIKELN